MGQQDQGKNYLRGLKDRSVVDICTEYAISQAMYYKWRDIFLANIDQPFETNSKSKKEQKLEQENNKLRKVIGDLTIELKKKQLVKFRRKASRNRENLDAPLEYFRKRLRIISTRFKPIFSVKRGNFFKSDFDCIFKLL